METNKDLKVAIIHDFLTQYGGAERVLEVLSEIYPNAPIYTLLYAPEKMHGKFSGRVIRTSYLQKFPKCLRKRYRFLLPLFPAAPEAFDLREYDLVLSSSGAWAKGIVTKLNTVHICYLHSPMRFVWDYNERYLQEKKVGFLKMIIRPYLSYLRIWDRLSADRPDYIITNSQYTRERVKKYYGRESTVIYPPVDYSLIRSAKADHLLPQAGEGEKGSYFLVVSRLSAYKKTDMVIEAFNKLQLPLVIVGEGKQMKYLKSIAGKNITFRGWVSDEKMEKIYANARAFIFPVVDDFGIAPCEAMLRGIPVVALNKGGIKEVMVENKTGEFFEAATPEIIADGVRRFIENEKNYDKEFIKQRAAEFGKDRFIREFREYIDNITQKSN